MLEKIGSSVLKGQNITDFSPKCRLLNDSKNKSEEGVIQYIKDVVVTLKTKKKKRQHKSERKTVEARTQHAKIFNHFQNF